ncbi:MAG: GldG family protein, partial [Elusimicrobia bacterium]|nr:GldG family protein [Elusimicrobiota bacterium]
AAVVAVAVALGALNLAGQIFYGRWDFSEGKIYSPSKATKRVLKNLEDPIIVKGYFSQDLPQPYATYRDYLKDLLRSYRNDAGKNLEYKFIHYPGDDQKFRSEALSMGVAPVRVTTIVKDKYEIKDGFMGLVLIHGDRKETIPVIRDIKGLEYDLTTRIRKLVTKEARQVALLASHGTEDLSAETEEAVRENYDIQKVELAEILKSPKKPQSLILVGPSQKFSDEDLAVLEQLILQGMPVGLFLNTKSVNVGSGLFMASNIETGLDRLLTHWGLEMKKGFVLDLQNQNVAVQQRAGPFLINNVVNYPPLPIITRLSEDNPITKEMDQVMLPFASPISTENVKNLKVEPLAMTTRLSWFKSDLINLAPMSRFDPDPKDPKGPFIVACAIEGKMTALFPSAPGGVASSTSSASSWLKESAGTSRVLLVGTSKLLDSRIPADASNQIFFLNSVDWLSEDADLVAVRSRGAKLRPFTRELGDIGRQMVKLTSLLLMPVVVVLAGLAIWGRRIRWKKNLRRELHVEPGGTVPA